MGDGILSRVRPLRFPVYMVYSRHPWRRSLAAVVQREGMPGPPVFLAATITEFVPC